jgi:dihydroorotate dehydrogenase (NAD+) catalytic subunit
MNKIYPSVKICGVQFKNPVIAASGTFGYGKEYARFIDVCALGGICTKGLTLNAREGNKGERLCETPSGLLNSIGLENPGIEYFIKNELPALKKTGSVVIANLCGSSIEEYKEGAVLLSASSVDMIELNISCPNVKAGGMAFGLDASSAASVVSAVKKVCRKPLIVKLSPNAPDIISVAKASVCEGAEALSLVNTFKAMAIDIKKRRPVFDNISAGLSGPAIRPIALRIVWELYENVSVPIIGIGGISDVDSALQFLLAGASAIEIGSATFVHPATMIEIINGITQYMNENKIDTIDKLNIRKQK